jgi:hypothetical protein
MESVNCKDRPAFPNRCPNCGQGANIPLAIEKAFARNMRRRSDDRVIVRFKIPFCHACALAHQHESPTRKRLLWRRLFRRGGSGFYMLLAGVATAYASWFDPFGKAASFPVWQRILIPAGLLLLAATFFAIALWQTRHMTILPPSSITSAVDFTDKLSTNFDPAWRQFLFRREDYARTFREVNRDRLWDTEGVEAERSEQKGRLYRRGERIVVRTGIAAFVLWVLWRWLRDSP